MEDALVQMRSALMTQHSKVLILVLMEDALVPPVLANGKTEMEFVLILVLMEDALVPGDNELGKSTLLKVLILVLMEDALVQTKKLRYRHDGQLS